MAHQPALADLPASIANWPELDGDVLGFRPAEACKVAASWFDRVATVNTKHRTLAPNHKRVERIDGRVRWVDTDTGEILGAPCLDGNGRLTGTHTGPLPAGTEMPAGVASQNISFMVSPGSVRVKVAKPSQAERTLAEIEAALEMDAFLAEMAEQQVLDWDACDVLGTARAAKAMDIVQERCAAELEAMAEGKPWNVVTVYSRKSRQRCRQMVAETDWYTPLQRPDARIGMLTLTYSDDWERWAPDPETIKKHRHAFEKRLERALGYLPSFVWVREWQRRGAPHFHLAGVFPKRINGERLEIWISRNWFEVVGSDDLDHLKAGTRTDWSKGLEASDPNRMAAYFSAYTTGANGKEYQHHPPEGWSNPNGSVGRHWGHRGCTRVREELRLSRDQLIEVQRFLRRYIAAQKRTMRTKGINGQRTRTVNRRWQLCSLKGMESGFTLLTNDGPALALAIATATTPTQETPWPPGQRRPLP